MTRAEIPAMCDACPARRSTLPFDVADMVAMRLKPAQFARVVGVSKQSVSKWIAAGKVTLGPDGRLDPQAAIEDVLRNTAPAKLRARIFRQAMQGADLLRARIRSLEANSSAHEGQVRKIREAWAKEVKRLNRKIQDAEMETMEKLSGFRLELILRFDDLVDSRNGTSSTLVHRLSELQDKHFPRRSDGDTGQ